MNSEYIEHSSKVLVDEYLSFPINEMIYRISLEYSTNDYHSCMSKVLPTTINVGDDYHIYYGYNSPDYNIDYLIYLSSNKISFRKSIINGIPFSYGINLSEFDFNKQLSPNFNFITYKSYLNFVKLIKNVKWHYN